MAELGVSVAGLRFSHPVLAGPGPGTDGAQAIEAALEGGAAGAVTRTIFARPAPPPPEPSLVPYGSDGLLSAQAGSPLGLQAWLHRELPGAAQAARRHGAPLIASLAGSPEEVRQVGRELVAAGAQALELSTFFLEWPQAVEAARELRAAVEVPIWAKLSLTHGEDVAERARTLEPYVDAFTCMAGFGPVLDLDVEAGGKPRLGGTWGYGWLSGAPVHPIAARAVFEVARRVRRPVIASGGAMTARDVVEFLEVGASLVQVTAAVLLRGPGVLGELARGLSEWLDGHGRHSVQEVCGLYVKRFGHGQRVVTVAEEAPRLVEERCVRCSVCETVCFYDALVAPRRQLPVIDPARCFQCGLCVSVCPTDALLFRPREAVTMLPPP